MKATPSFEIGSLPQAPTTLEDHTPDLIFPHRQPPLSFPSLVFSSSGPNFKSTSILPTFPYSKDLGHHGGSLAMKVNPKGCPNPRSPHPDEGLDSTTSKKTLKQKKYSTRYPMPEKPRQKRAVIQDMVRPLKQWLLRHRHNPYPTKGEKMDLAIGSNMSLVQVSNWFANARRRLKNVVQDSKCSWSKRLRMYNQFVQGNAELLSISSNDSIWNSDSEEEETEVELDEKDATKTPPSPKGDSEDRDIDVEHVDEKDPGSEEEDRLNIPLYKKNMMQRYLSDSVDLAQDSPKQSLPGPVLARSAPKRKIPETVSPDQGPPVKRPHVIPNPVLHPRPILPRMLVSNFEAFPQPMFSAFQPMNNTFTSFADHPLLRMSHSGQKASGVPPLVPGLVPHGNFPLHGIWSPSSQIRMPFATSRLIHPPSCPAPSMLI